jgi:hypothetical protein
MCKHIAGEANENRRDIIEIKGHLGLPTDSYRELPDFDDPFAEWDVMDAAQAATAAADHEDVEDPAPPCSTHARCSTQSTRAAVEEEEEEEDASSDDDDVEDPPYSD